MASSVIVFAMASVVFFIVGILCGRFCLKKRKTAETVPPSRQTQIPYYDDVVLQQTEHELEPKGNVAYYTPVR